MQSWICIAQHTPSLNIQNLVCTLVNWLGSITRGSAMKWLWRRNKLNTFYSLSAGCMLMTLLLRWLSCIMLCMYMCIYHTQARNASTHVFVNVYTVYTYGFRGNLEKKTRLWLTWFTVVLHDSNGLWVGWIQSSVECVPIYTSDIETSLAICILVYKQMVINRWHITM